TSSRSALRFLRVKGISGDPVEPELGIVPVRSACNDLKARPANASQATPLVEQLKKLNGCAGPAVALQPPATTARPQHRVAQLLTAPKAVDREDGHRRAAVALDDTHAAITQLANHEQTIARQAKRKENEQVKQRKPTHNDRTLVLAHRL